jgi:hypothetical protein
MDINNLTVAELEEIVGCEIEEVYEHCANRYRLQIVVDLVDAGFSERDIETMYGGQRLQGEMLDVQIKLDEKGRAYHI